MAKSSRIWNARSIISLVLLLVLVLSLGNANIKKATAQNSVVYDYYFLIDTSGSMMNPPPEGGPAKIEQVKTIAQNFVDEIPEGATFILYTFTTQSNPVGVGTWKNIQSSDKEAIKQTISKISISIPQNTALWDSVCQALDTLDQLAKSLPPQTLRNPVKSHT
jgi:hypothetical protein